MDPGPDKSIVPLPSEALAVLRTVYVAFLNGDHLSDEDDSAARRLLNWNGDPSGHI